MATSKVAVLRVPPDHILEDVDRRCELGGVSAALSPEAPTILKANISWHFPFPAANTTPWQLEGSILALRRHGFRDLVCVQNKTEVTDAAKGEELNGYTPVLRAHDVPVRFNFRDEDMRWIPYRPRARMRTLHRIYGESLRIPDFFVGRN